LEMYPICLGSLPVDPHTGDSCQGWISLFTTILSFVWSCLCVFCILASSFFLADQLLV
jgi:hypothetical protein